LVFGRRDRDRGPRGARAGRFGRLARELDLVATAGSDFHGSIEGRKFPGGVSGDEKMLEALRARKR
jgi:hypothetical protein